MASRAPAVERAVAILHLIASHPGERFTLSELARETGVNKGSLHAILGALTDAGHLHRDESQKTYGLGPALIALGNAALAFTPVVQVAMPEMQALSRDLNLDCVCSVGIRDEIVILAASDLRPFGIYIQPGQRLPLAPPMGTVFVAWSGPAVIERWLAKLGPGVRRGDVARYRRAIEVVRERGYSIGLESDAQQRLVRALSDAGHASDSAVRSSMQRLRTEEYALDEVEPERSYRLNHLGAPVFGSDGEVALGMFLIGFQGDLPATLVPALAEHLLAAARRVTKAIHGQAPGTLERA